MGYFNQYVRAESLEEAYGLYQKKNNFVLGGMLWLKMRKRPFGTAIDLSDLGLDQIEEDEKEFRIGAYVSLRELETNEALNTYTKGAFAESVKHIVGVQFRNVATVGGSLWGRYGFSDVMTIFRAMGAKVQLHHAGILDLDEFVKMPRKTRDILVSVIVPKKVKAVVYLSQRNQSTDFPVLTCAVAKREEGYVAAVGATPHLAENVWDKEGILTEINEESIEKFAAKVAEQIRFGSNMRAGAAYRRIVCQVLVKRALHTIVAENNGEEMEVTITLNGKKITDSVDADMVLLDFCRKHKCFSVKRGCETGNCGLCSVLLDGKPVLSCSVPIGRASGRKVDTLEGLQEEAKKFSDFFAVQGADQCGFCNPGYIVNIVALLRENPDPTDEEILEYLSGNLCRCTGYQSQLRSLRNYLNSKKEAAPLDLEAEVYGADIGREWKHE